MKVFSLFLMFAFSSCATSTEWCKAPKLTECKDAHGKVFETTSVECPDLYLLVSGDSCIEFLEKDYDVYKKMDSLKYYGGYGVTIEDKGLLLNHR